MDSTYRKPLLLSRNPAIPLDRPTVDLFAPFRLNTKTGQFTEYLLPRDTNIRRVFVDNSTTPVTFWVGNNHGRSIVKVEPQE